MLEPHRPASSSTAPPLSSQPFVHTLSDLKPQQSSDVRLSSMHWDEFVEYRKENQKKLKELFDLVEQRREKEVRLARSCTQLETKVERCARHTKELQSRGEALEDHLKLHRKALEGTTETGEGVRERVNRLAQEFDAVVAALRGELSEQQERQAQLSAEAIRRGDRAVAEEILLKVAEGKLCFQETLSVAAQQLTHDFAEQRRAGDAAIAVVIEDSEARLRVEAQAQLETQLSESAKKLERQLGEAAVRLESLEHLQQQASGRLEGLDAKVHDGLGKADEKVRALEASSQNLVSTTAERLKEQLEDFGASAAQGLQRIRGEVEHSAREAVRAACAACSAELREEISFVREQLPDELRGARDDLRAGLASCREWAQRSDDTSSDLSSLRMELQSVCREMVAMVHDVQRQVVESQQQSSEKFFGLSTGQKLQESVDAGLSDIRDQLGVVRRDCGREAQSAATSSESVAQAVESLRQRLTELSSLVSSAQASSETATKEVARCQAGSENGIADLRKEVTQEVQDLSERHTALLSQSQRQVDAIHHELRERASGLQKDLGDLGAALERAEHALKSQGSQLSQAQKEIARHGAATSGELADLRSSFRAERVEKGFLAADKLTSNGSAGRDISPPSRGFAEVRHARQHCFADAPGASASCSTADVGASASCSTTQDSRGSRMPTSYFGAQARLERDEPPTSERPRDRGGALRETSTPLPLGAGAAATPLLGPATRRALSGCDTASTRSPRQTQTTPRRLGGNPSSYERLWRRQGDFGELMSR